VGSHRHTSSLSLVVEGRPELVKAPRVQREGGLGNRAGRGCLRLDCAARGEPGGNFVSPRTAKRHGVASARLGTLAALLAAMGGRGCVARGDSVTKAQILRCGFTALGLRPDVVDRGGVWIRRFGVGRNWLATKPALPMISLGELG